MSYYHTFADKIPFTAEKFAKIIQKTREFLSCISVHGKDISFLKDVVHARKVDLHATITPSLAEEIRRLHCPHNNSDCFTIKREKGNKERLTIVKKKKGNDFQVIEKDVPFYSIRDILLYLLFEKKTGPVAKISP